MLGPSRAIATMLASVLLVAPALAQPKVSDKDKRTANALVKRAIAKSQAKQHLEAIELYQQAYAVVPLPTLLSNIGTEYQQARKPIEALKYFCMYLEEDPTGPLRTYATAQAKELQLDLGRGELSDAEVCQPGPASDGASELPGDGSLTGTADLDTAPATTDDAPGRGLRIAGLVAGITGVGALGVGLYYGIEAKQISDTITNYRDPNMPWPDDIRRLEDRGQTYEDRQIVALIAGGALVVSGGVLYLLGRSRSPEQVTVVPTASEGGGSVTVFGRF